MTLRRLDWDIFHIRSSEYYTDPEKTLNRLLKRLDQAGITPRQTEPSELKAILPDLYELVTKKANNIRIRWSETIEPIRLEPQENQEHKTAETA